MKYDPITKSEIEKGLQCGYIRLIVDPNMESGTVCLIGEHWFYFGGLTAEELSPREYFREVPISDIADEIFCALTSFRNDSNFIHEYLYYCCWLNEQKKE